MAELPVTPKLAIVTTPGGARFNVAAEYAPQFQGFLNELATQYQIDPATSGGYNRRYIAGTTTPSEHAFGRAIDVNWNANPRGGTNFNIPPEVAHELAKKYNMTWGGDWSGGTRDPMHFQVNTSGTAPVSMAPASTVAPTPGQVPPIVNENTNAPAVTPTSSDIATAFQTHLASLQQEQQNLQLQQQTVDQQQKRLAFGLQGSPETTFAGNIAGALRGLAF